MQFILTKQEYDLLSHKQAMDIITVLVQLRDKPATLKIFIDTLNAIQMGYHLDLETFVESMHRELLEQELKEEL